jgi:hypothetical protein
MFHSFATSRMFDFCHPEWADRNSWQLWWGLLKLEKYFRFSLNFQPLRIFNIDKQAFIGTLLVIME